MERLKKYDDGINSGQKAPDELNTPALDEVIAQIDREADQMAVSEPKKHQKDRLMESAVKPRLAQFILFTLEKTFFALPLANALEIGHRPDIAPLPNLPNWILGISNVRGEIISLVNLKAFLGIPSSGAQGERRFIIIYNQDMKVGIVVDKTPGMLSMDKINSDIQTSPYRQGEFVKYIKGVTVSGENIINILDIDRLLSSLRISEFETD